MDAADIDATRSEEAGAALEQIERHVEREAGVLRQRPQLGRRLIGLAADR